MRVLCVADEESPALTLPRLRALAPTLIVGCGDLSWRYLEFLTSAADVPLVLVPGNHDPHRPQVRLHRSGLWTRAGLPTSPPRPLGGLDLDVRVGRVAGLTLAGLGGSVRYRPGPNQHSQREYEWRVGRLIRRARRALKGARLDLLLTHAPPRGLGDEEDPPHHGIEALHRAVTVLQPRYLVHGHIHPHGRPRPDRTIGATTVCNVVPYRVLDLTPSVREED